MLGKKKRCMNKVLWTVFALLMAAAVTVFGIRFHTGSVAAAAPLTTGQLIYNSGIYEMGMICDRNGNVIVEGTASGDVYWSDSQAQDIMESMLGVDLNATLNSPYTVLGTCPWLYGMNDNRLDIKGLLTPWEDRVGGDVKLTIDMELQREIDRVIDESGYEDGRVVVSDYRTGEILAMYGDVQTQITAPGSTMKPILAAAILNVRPDLRTFTYNCVSENHYFYTEEGSRHYISCVGGAEHGVMDMDRAMAHSCNGYFISLLQQVDKEVLLQELQKWGYDTTIQYDDFHYHDHVFLGSGTESTDMLLAAIGQANAGITTLGLNNCMSAILNHGVLQEPKLIDSVVYQAGEDWTLREEGEQYEICSTDIADDVMSMMQGVTEYGTGKKFAYPGFLAKTGTSEKIIVEQGSNDNTYAVWTAGGLTSEEYPYCITVCLDNVDRTTTSADAGIVAREILKYIVEGGR